MARRISSAGAKKFTSMICRRIASVRVGEVAAAGDAGVVDQHVEAAELCHGLVDRRSALVLVFGHVGRDRNAGLPRAGRATRRARASLSAERAASDEAVRPGGRVAPPGPRPIPLDAPVMRIRRPLSVRFMAGRSLLNHARPPRGRAWWHFAAFLLQVYQTAATWPAVLT